MNNLKIKSIKSALIASGGAALTYLLSWATEQDFGIYTPMVVAALSVLVNFLKELARKESE